MRFYQSRLLFCRCRPAGILAEGGHVSRQKHNHPAPQKNPGCINQIGVDEVGTHNRQAFMRKGLPSGPANSVFPVSFLYLSTISRAAFNRPSEVSCMSVRARSICDIQQSTARSTPDAISAAIRSTIWLSLLVSVAVNINPPRFVFDNRERVSRTNLPPPVPLELLVGSLFRSRRFLALLHVFLHSLLVPGHHFTQFGLLFRGQYLIRLRCQQGVLHFELRMYLGLLRSNRLRLCWFEVAAGDELHHCFVALVLLLPQRLKRWFCVVKDLFDLGVLLIRQ